MFSSFLSFFFTGGGGGQLDFSFQDEVEFFFLTEFVFGRGGGGGGLTFSQTVVGSQKYIKYFLPIMSLTIKGGGGGLANF